MITIQKKRGDTWKFAGWIADNIGNPITDFTDFKIWMTIKSQSSDTDENAVAQISLETGGIVVADLDTGKIIGTFESEVTSEIEPKSYVVDFRVKDAVGTVKTSDTITINCVVNITGAS